MDHTYNKLTNTQKTHIHPYTLKLENQEEGGKEREGEEGGEGGEGGEG